MDRVLVSSLYEVSRMELQAVEIRYGTGKQVAILSLQQHLWHVAAVASTFKPAAVRFSAAFAMSAYVLRGGNNSSGNFLCA